MNDAGDNSMGNNNSISGVSGGDDVDVAVAPLPQDSSSSSGRSTKRHKHLQDVVFDRGSDERPGDTTGQDVDSSWLVNAHVAAAAAADALDDRKPAALPSNSDSSTLDDNNNDNEVRNSQKRKLGDADDNNDYGGVDNESLPLPLAPSLEVFLTPGGHIKYAPRPEWCQFTKDPSEEEAAAVTTVAAATSGEEEGKNPISMATIQSRATVPLIPNRDENDDGGGAHQPPPVDGLGGDADNNNNINQIAIHEDDATAQVVRGGNNPLRAPPVAVGGRRNRFRGGHVSVLERIGRAQEWHEQEWNMRQIDRQYGLRRSHHNDVALEILAPPPPPPPPGLDNDAFIPLVLRRDQLYYMSRGAPLQRAAFLDHPAAAAPRLIGLENIERMHDGEVGEENEEGGMINVERVAHESEVLADDRDVVPPIVLQGLMPESEQDYPLSQSFREKVAVFGYDCDTALHKAIKLHATEAALGLIREGACVDIPNAKGVTPLMIASQEGNLDVVRALLNRGANANTAMPQRSGSTALIQASHFGKLAIVEELLRHGAQVDQANLKNTTALMRACQEGHEGVVRLLLSHNASVNRRNDERMTSLMLASQRGHASIVEMLVRAGAQVDAKTYQDSTSLMLACKRKHLNVAKILVASGTELKLKDSKNRTVLETATRRGHEAFIRILTDSGQIRLMQDVSRRERNLEMARIWKLLQLERATIQSGTAKMTIHNVADSVKGGGNPLKQLCQSKRALGLAMTLPAPLVELISSFIPLALIWEKRLMLLTSRSHIDPDSAVFNALDLIDEVLEVGGLLDALDAAGVEPPTNFASWAAYRLWRSRLEVESAEMLRRVCNYLQVLARAPPSLSTIIHSHPYDMPVALFSKLKAHHDIQSAVRRLSGGGIHFDSSIANEMLVIARMAVMWCESRPMY